MHELRMDDEAFLEWWRDVFASRFVNGALPTPGTSLLGTRLRLQYEDRDGWHMWPPPAVPEPSARLRDDPRAEIR